jgi:hypothetical protein
LFRGEGRITKIFIGGKDITAIRADQNFIVSLNQVSSFPESLG